ncbi:MAG: hypothetical protein H0X63_04920 [Flavobacteriales bacterium]|nr:hypothetical protein [Flavobacteriales bacterium]
MPFLNALVFFCLGVVALYATISYKQVALVIVLSILVAISTRFVKGLFSKLLVIQFLLVLTTAYGLAGIVKQYVFSSDKWMQQPDAIEGVVFKKTPNVYVIQPDGYINFSELGKGYYNFDNSKFENWLHEKDFKFYADFRSNYYTTLHSNSSLFTMKHHYYDILDERKVIMDKNPVVTIFNNNGYKTHFLSEVPYLIVNRPKINFDYSNFNLKNLPYLSKGLDMHRDILEDLPQVLKQSDEKNFYFFQKLLPGHITNYKEAIDNIEYERERYLKNIEYANNWLIKIINIITENDPKGIIIIVADHGGFVGMNTTYEAHEKTTDRDKIYSIFSSILAIKWPETDKPHFDDTFKSSVNLFRILFSYLAEDQSFLENTEEDASFMKIERAAPKGIYKYIDKNGNIVFDKIE